MKCFILGLALIIILGVGSAAATPVNKFIFNNKYGTTGTVLNVCNLCHVSSNPSSPVEFNPYGAALSVQGSGIDFTLRLTNIENDDSDGDGVINLMEITHDTTFPGDPDSVPLVKATWRDVKVLFR